MVKKTDDTIQIPLAVDLEARVDPSSTNTDTTYETISYIRNGMVETNSTNNTKYVRRRGGYEMLTTNTGITTIKGHIYNTPFDKHVYVAKTVSLGYDRLYYTVVGTSSGVLTLSGLGANELLQYDMTHYEENGNPYIVVVGSNSTTTPSGGYCWVYNVFANTLVQLTNATHGFPDTVELTRGVVVLDNYIFVMNTDGKIYNSNVGDRLTWTSTDFLTANTSEDRKVFMTKHSDHIAVLGTSAITFYYDAGHPAGSPLSIRKDLTINKGVVTKRDGTGTSNLDYVKSVASDNELIVFLASKGDGNYTNSVMQHAGIYIIDNFKLEKISTVAVDQYISQQTELDPNIGIQIIEGRKFIFVGNLGLVYDTEERIWMWWTWASDSGFGFSTMYGEFATVSIDNIIKYNAEYTKDQVTTGTPTYWTFPFTIQTPQITLGTSNNKFCRETSLIGDYTPSSSIINITWSDDNYQNFSTERAFDLSTYNKFTRCGMFRKRAWKISQDYLDTGAGVPLRVSHIEIKVDGANVNTAD